MPRYSFVTFDNVVNIYWPAGEVRFDMAAQQAPRPWSICGRSATVAIPNSLNSHALRRRSPIAHVAI